MFNMVNRWVSAQGAVEFQKHSQTNLARLQVPGAAAQGMGNRTCSETHTRTGKNTSPQGPQCKELITTRLAIGGHNHADIRRNNKCVCNQTCMILSTCTIIHIHPPPPGWVLTSAALPTTPRPPTAAPRSLAAITARWADPTTAHPKLCKADCAGEQHE